MTYDLLNIVMDWLYKKFKDLSLDVIQRISSFVHFENSHSFFFSSFFRHLANAGWKKLKKHKKNMQEYSIVQNSIHTHASDHAGDPSHPHYTHTQHDVRIILCFLHQQQAKVSS